MVFNWSWSINDVLVLVTWVVLVVVVLSSLFVYVVKPAVKRPSKQGGLTSISPKSPSTKSTPPSSQSNNDNVDDDPSENSSLLPKGNFLGVKLFENSTGKSETVLEGAKSSLQGSSNQSISSMGNGANSGGSKISRNSSQRVSALPSTALADTLRTVLSHGMVILMHTQDGPKQITLTLSQQSYELHWKSVKIFTRKTYKLNLRDVVSVERGKHTNVFRQSKASTVSDDVCLSIVTTTHTLDLEAATKVERDVFADGLDNMLAELRAGKNVGSGNSSNV